MTHAAPDDPPHNVVELVKRPQPQPQPQPLMPPDILIRPSGWYPHGDQGLQRWFDGTRWTPYTRYPPPVVYRPAPYSQPYAVTYATNPTSHGLHLFMTIVTCGWWGLLVWIPITIYNANKKNQEVTRFYPGG